nr:Carboxylesterase domain containing protein [Haemonchus contortus]
MVGALVLLVGTLVCSLAQILELKPGRVRGFEYTTKGGDIAEVFLGVPYAAAPVGELRFEKPVPVSPWKGVRNGTQFGATCHPHARKAAVSPDPSEDCLTLNVIRPRKEAPAGGYPILLWVHGGGYEIGSTSLYGYKGFADIYIPHDIIVVTLQYRLGVYGFFSSGDSRIPGNLGLFDMAEAVKFVYENAEKIGADPSRITAWGLSADYIARSIEMSGSPWVAWALGPNVPKYSLELAEVLECTNDLKNCMKHKTIEEIYEATEKVVSEFYGYASSGLDSIKWGPVIDGEFLQDPDEMAAAAPPKASIVGVSNKEAAFMTIKARRNATLTNFGIKEDDFVTWNRDKLVASIKKLIPHGFFESKTDEVIDKLVAYYADRDEEDAYEFYLDRYTEFLSDVLFNVAAVDGILARREEGWNLFAYSFNHYNRAIWSDNIPERLRGSPHVNEFPYMFDVFALGEFEIDETEQIVADVVQQSFINFAKTGVPLNQHARWQGVGTSTNLRHLAISPEPRMEEGFYDEPTALWHQLREYGYDVIKHSTIGGVDRIVKNEL